MIKTYNANLVRSLVKELLILNRTEGAMAADPPNPERLEQRKFKRMRLRQELVQALSSQAPEEMLNHAEPH